MLRQRATEHIAEQTSVSIRTLLPACKSMQPEIPTRLRLTPVSERH
jgi:hypothetical protein